MELLKLETSSGNIGVLLILVYEKVKEFQYFGVWLSTKNDQECEIRGRIPKAEKALFA